MSIELIPLEILTTITGYLFIPDLASLCKVNKHLHNVLQLELYEHLRLERCPVYGNAALLSAATRGDTITVSWLVTRGSVMSYIQAGSNIINYATYFEDPVTAQTL